MIDAPSRIYVDVTETLALDVRTGIQRVVRSITHEEKESGGRATIVPVVAIARQFRPLSAVGIQRLLGRDAAVVAPVPPGRPTLSGTLAKLALAPFPRLIQRLKRQRNARLLETLLQGLWEEPPIMFRLGDRVVLADTYDRSSALAAGQAAQRSGATLIVLTYDLIPIHYPELLDSSMVERFRDAVLPAIAAADAVLSISKWSVADLRKFGVSKPIGYFYLGHDLADGMQAASVASQAWPQDLWSGVPVFLMIGTMARHKGHLIALEAIERLWANGTEARLIIIGGSGWDAALISRFQEHPELNRQLFLLHNVADDMLVEALRRVTAVMQCSAIEGFGLPIIEALSHGAPVIASDIPVFREVAGEAVLFFAQGDSAELASAMIRMVHERADWAVRAANFRWIDWAAARAQFVAEVERLSKPGGYQ